MNPSPITQHVANARGAELTRDPLPPARTIGDQPMKHRLRFHHLLVTGIVALAAALAVTGVAHASLEPPTVPTEIQVGDGNKVFLVGHAVGVQIYSCNATPSGFKWGPVAPRADLYDDRGKLIATHLGGPTWQATDGSRVMGQRVDGVTDQEDLVAVANLDLGRHGGWLEARLGHARQRQGRRQRDEPRHEQVVEAKAALHRSISDRSGGFE